MEKLPTSLENLLSDLRRAMVSPTDTVSRVDDRDNVALSLHDRMAVTTNDVDEAFGFPVAESV